MTNYVKTLVMSLAVVFSMSFAASAAQQAQDGQAPDAPKIQAQHFDDATLEKFTTAMDAVSNVANEFQAELSGNETPEKMKEIQTAARGKMVSEIEKAGLEVDTYTTIAQLVQTDEKLRERVLTIARQQDNS